jgi:hypothetical protein
MKKYVVICDGCGIEGSSTQGKRCKQLHQLRAELKANEGWLILGTSGEDYCPKCKGKYKKELSDFTQSELKEIQEQTVNALTGMISKQQRSRGGVLIPHAADFSRVHRRINAIEERLKKLEDKNDHTV